MTWRDINDKFDQYLVLWNNSTDQWPKSVIDGIDSIDDPLTVLLTRGWWRAMTGIVTSNQKKKLLLLLKWQWREPEMILTKSGSNQCWSIEAWSSIIEIFGIDDIIIIDDGNDVLLKSVGIINGSVVYYSLLLINIIEMESQKGNQWPFPLLTNDDIFRNGNEAKWFWPLTTYWSNIIDIVGIDSIPNDIVSIDIIIIDEERGNDIWNYCVIVLISDDDVIDTMMEGIVIDTVLLILILLTILMTNDVIHW